MENNNKFQKCRAATLEEKNTEGYNVKTSIRVSQQVCDCNVNNNFLDAALRVVFARAQRGTESLKTAKGGRDRANLQIGYNQQPVVQKTAGGISSRSE